MDRRVIGGSLVLGGLLAIGVSGALLADREEAVWPPPSVHRATDGCVEAFNRAVDVVVRDEGLTNTATVPRLRAAAKQTRPFDGGLADGMEHLAKGKTVDDWRDRLVVLLDSCEERGWTPPAYVEMDWLYPAERRPPS